jgi:hypothetical protein
MSMSLQIREKFVKWYVVMPEVSSSFRVRPFFLIGIVGAGVQLGPLGTAATNGLLCQPRVIMMMEKLVE